MVDGFRPDPLFTSSFTEFEGTHDRERIVEGTAYAVIQRESPRFFSLVENTLLKNKLNDPYTQEFTIFAPITFDRDILEKFHAELLISHAIVPYMFLPWGKDVVLDMLDQHVCRVRNNMIDGKKILSSIQCSNGMVHIIEDILSPSLFGAEWVY
jgi:hypothetical protein